MRTVLLSSGLGHVSRGVEIWMLEMLHHWPEGGGDVELWSGGPVPTLQTDPRYRNLGSLGRENPLIRRFSWASRYRWEQQACFLKTLQRLRRRSVDVIYCGDPVLSWHLKRFQKWHGASVVFMNGMRLSPHWGNHLDAVHLLADPYLEQARMELGPSAKAHFFAVPHFADTETFRPLPENEARAARASFGLPDDRFLVLTVGPLGHVSGKRTEFLAAEVAAAGENVHLIHAGVEEDGAAEVRKQSNSLLGPRIHWLGRVERERMPALYSAAHCYSLGSLAEPFSIAILEALASGLPVVHHRDEVMCWQSGPGGIPVDMTVSGAAAKEISDLAGDSDYSGRRQAARNWAESRYRPEPICARIVAELKEVRRQYREGGHRTGQPEATVAPPAL